MTSRQSKRFFLPLLVSLLSGGLLMAGCDILDTANPNSLTEDDLSNPEAAAALANGAEASLTRAMSIIVGFPSVASDEVTWVGSRNSWQVIDSGNLDDQLITYSNRGWTFITEARFTTEDHVGRLEAFREAGTLLDDRLLVRAYIYAAIARIKIADVYDDFVFSSRQEAAPSVGEANMASLYDTAVAYVNSGLALAPSSDLEQVLLGLRARAKFRKSIWEKVNPVGEVNTSDPLVDNADAAADAAAALEVMPEGYRYQLELDPSLSLVPFDIALAEHTNERLELRFGDLYVEPTEEGNRVESVDFPDAIDEDRPAPFLVEVINEFTAADQFADMTIVSSQEMHLIRAETALAQGDLETFTDEINAIRSAYDLTPYSGQIPAQEMLIHARRVYLFLQGRRLADHYRFDDPADRWAPESSAAQRPGTFFSIPSIERQSNPNL